ncbi:hypothetical protein [Plebeiibacterium sediminum]|uniref:Glycosyltransferase subfamily 4-like N-terminal domain-containing protein n=1 Tax=Plebeiibacterium sediminum TaxID=2992112 RepID=A0AAE3M8N5_9BACT|nr:hypothetical protein [Plebeiobacterium sediminum]MCW3789199.1 hypothetical protein [Plebeiobacterium sediminum]
MRRKIVFLTTNNLPTNPRLLKEIDVAKESYSVTVILWKLGNWSDAINESQLKERSSVKFIQLDATPKRKIHWLFWALLEKLIRYIYPIVKSNVFFNALCHTRRSIQIYHTLKKIKNIDLLVAHNLGSLYPTWKLASKKNIPFIYDIEDYDPGIFVPEAGEHYKSCTEYLLKKCAPSANALTSASPLIGKYTLKQIGGHPNYHVILNSFPASEFKEPSNQRINESTNQLKLIWFSQTISFGRGLEQLFEALSQIEQSNNQQIVLTLIGNLDPVFDQQIIQPLLKNFANHLINKSSNQLTINYIPPLSQPALHAELANHDIGLALEFNSTDLNRQLCLTNKIIAYAQAGLFILATDTEAQKIFLKINPSLGKITEQSSCKLKSTIKYLLNNKEDIYQTIIQRFNSSKSLCWENECQKLKFIWKEIIN